MMMKFQSFLSLVPVLLLLLLLSLVIGVSGSYVGLTDATIHEAVRLWTSNDAHNLETIRMIYGPIQHWNVSTVTDMSALFTNAIHFNTPLDQWNVAKVTTMAHMFHGASHFNQDLSAWNMQSIQTIQGMFAKASSLTIDTLCWDTLPHNLQFAQMQDMFCGTNGAAFDPCCPNMPSHQYDHACTCTQTDMSPPTCHRFCAAHTHSPSFTPSTFPTNMPTTTMPSSQPSMAPSITPSQMPTTAPSMAPTSTPSQMPTKAPSITPSTIPTIAPTTMTPSSRPSRSPTRNPSQMPTTSTGSYHLSLAGTNRPTPYPTSKPPTPYPTSSKPVTPLPTPTPSPTSTSSSPSITPSSQAPSYAPTKALNYTTDPQITLIGRDYNFTRAPQPPLEQEEEEEEEILTEDELFGNTNNNGGINVISIQQEPGASLPGTLRTNAHSSPQQAEWVPYVVGTTVGLVVAALLLALVVRRQRRQHEQLRLTSSKDDEYDNDCNEDDWDTLQLDVEEQAVQEILQKQQQQQQRRPIADAPITIEQRIRTSGEEALELSYYDDGSWEQDWQDEIVLRRNSTSSSFRLAADEVAVREVMRTEQQQQPPNPNDTSGDSFVITRIVVHDRDKQQEQQLRPGRQR